MKDCATMQHVACYIVAWFVQALIQNHIKLYYNHTTMQHVPVHFCTMQRATSKFVAQSKNCTAQTNATLQHATMQHVACYIVAWFVLALNDMRILIGSATVEPQKLFQIAASRYPLNQQDKIKICGYRSDTNENYYSWFFIEKIRIIIIINFHFLHKMTLH